MSRTEKILRRRSNWLRWRKLHGYACVVCGIDLDDTDLVDDADPREPRTCMEHCGTPVDLDAL
jgi:hypothetical protein